MLRKHTPRVCLGHEFSPGGQAVTGALGQTPPSLFHLFTGVIPDLARTHSHLKLAERTLFKGLGDRSAFKQSTKLNSPREGKHRGAACSALLHSAQGLARPWRREALFSGLPTWINEFPAMLNDGTTLSNTGVIVPETTGRLPKWQQIPQQCDPGAVMEPSYSWSLNLISCQLSLPYSCSWNLWKCAAHSLSDFQSQTC